MCNLPGYLPHLDDFANPAMGRTLPGYRTDITAAGSKHDWNLLLTGKALAGKVSNIQASGTSDTDFARIYVYHNPVRVAGYDLGDGGVADRALAVCLSQLRQGQIYGFAHSGLL